MLRSCTVASLSFWILTLSACGEDPSSPDMSQPPDMQVTYTVLASASTGGSIDPAVQTVAAGATVSFTITPATGYGTAEVLGCGGTLVGDTYTTAPITESCAVTAVFSLGRYMITTDAKAGGAIDPGSARVDHGETAIFTITADDAHTIEAVTGCGGTLEGTTYTTAPASADCVVTASFATKIHTVTATANAGGMISPATQMVAHGETGAVAITVSANQGLLSVSGCGGTLAGTTYTTGPVTADCTVSVSFVALNRIWAGGSHTCALSAATGLRCWGQNSSGQLGNAAQSLTAFGDQGGETASNAPILDLPAAGLVLADLSLGSQHTCAVWSDGRVYCAGESQNGQLGIGINADRKSMSVPVDLGGVAARQVSAGGQQTCALLEDGTIRCWGLNSSGELGDGTNSTHYTPSTPISFGAAQALQVCTGAAHTCARTTANEVYCWGDNSSGQLGDSNGGVDSNKPKIVVGLGAATVSKIACGGLFACAILSTGVKCWGENGSGQLGNNDGTNTDLDAASALLNLGGETAVDLALGGEHSCALTSTGKVYCWGESDAGQTGANTVTDRLMPVLVNLGAYTATHIEAGGDHVCVQLLPDDAGDTQRPFRCWGESGWGQLGLGSMSDIGDDELVNSTALNLFP